MPNRKNLLEVTAQLFAELGWRGTTTRRIAERAGVNEVTLFRKFGSKGSLLVEAINCQSDATTRPQLPQHPRDLHAELLQWATLHHDALRERSAMIRTCLAEFAEHPELGPVATRGAERTMTDLLRYLKEARSQRLIRPDGSLEAATQLFTNALFLDAITRDVVPLPTPLPPESTVAAFVDHLLFSLGTPT